MIKLTLDEKEFILASEWSDVSFGQYIDISDINKDEWYSDYEKAVRIVAATSDKPVELLNALLETDDETFNEIAKAFEWTNETIETHGTVTKESLTIDGRTYKIKKQYNKLTTGDMVSINTLLLNNLNLNPFEVAFGVLLREVKEDGTEVKLSMDSFTEVLTSLRNKVKLLDVYQHILFFSTGKTTSSTNNTKHFSIQKI